MPYFSCFKRLCTFSISVFGNYFAAFCFSANAKNGCLRASEALILFSGSISNKCPRRSYARCGSSLTSGQLRVKFINLFSLSTSACVMPPKSGLWTHLLEFSKKKEPKC